VTYALSLIERNSTLQSIFLPLLAVLFIGLKLTNYITWSWWLVLLPLYGGLALISAIFVIGCVIAILRS
jgi:hypothetical protein